MAGGFGQPITEPTNGWARVSLVRGQSGGATWAIDSQYTEARLSIGSAPDAGWCVTGIGVQPVHFELFWDGRSLWIADTRRAGGVTVNGRSVSDWLQLRGRVEVSFGSAGMLVETSEAPAQEMASNPGHATRVTLAPELVGDKRGTGSMNIASLKEAPGESWDPLPDEATRIASAPSERPPLDPESTRIAGMDGAPPIPGLPPLSPGLPSLSGVAPRAGAPRSNAPPPPPGLMRPRLGGSPLAPAAPAAPSANREMARTITGQEMSQHVAEATRIAAGLDAGGPSVQVQAGYPGVPSGGVSAGGFPPPGGGMPMQPGAPTMGGPMGGPMGGFAAPPTFDQAHAQQSAPADAGDAKKGKQSLPTRTWVLLGVTVLAAVGLMMMGPSGEEAAPPQPAAGVPGPLGTQPAGGAGAGATAGAGTAGAGTAGAGTGAAGTSAAGTAGAGAGAAGTGAAGTAATAGTGALPVPVPVAPTDGTTAPAGPTADRAAADLVIAGRFEEALPRYRALAVQHPERPEYGQMVRILERRMSQRCQGGVGPDGRACSPGGTTP